MAICIAGVLLSRLLSELKTPGFVKETDSNNGHNFCWLMMKCYPGVRIEREREREKKIKKYVYIYIYTHISFSF